MKRVKNNNVAYMIKIALLLIAIVASLVVSIPAANSENYAAIIQSINEKQATVMNVTAGAAASSAVLALLPGDATTPIANQILQISSWLMIVVCVLVLEKSLLPIMGCLAFRILIPIACGLFGFYIFLKKRTFKMVAVKLLLFAAMLVVLIPFSVKIGDAMCESHAAVIEQAVTDDTQEAQEEPTSWGKRLLDAFSENVSKAQEYAKQKLHQLIDAVAVFLVAYCVMPILVLLAMVWITKLLFMGTGKETASARDSDQTVREECIKKELQHRTHES